MKQLTEAPMPVTQLDLIGLKCPLPVIRTRKALIKMNPGEWIEVHCTDPLSIIDIPNLIRETGDHVEISEQSDTRIIFLIEKAHTAAG
ncbi:sulfurtransferase TusA family protein [soil metagenome]